MNLELQVCSLELAKRLEILGVKQRSYFKWSHFEDEKFPSWEICRVINITHNIIEKNECSALTVAELLELLPHRITIIENEPFNSFRFKLEKSFYLEQNDRQRVIYREDVYIVNYEADTWLPGSVMPPARLLSHNISDQNPANSLAMMLIYLIENKLMEIPK